MSSPSSPSSPLPPAELIQLADALARFDEGHQVSTPVARLTPAQATAVLSIWVLADVATLSLRDLRTAMESRKLPGPVPSLGAIGPLRDLAVAINRVSGGSGNLTDAVTAWTTVAARVEPDRIAEVIRNHDDCAVFILHSSALRCQIPYADRLRDPDVLTLVLQRLVNRQAAARVTNPTNPEPTDTNPMTAPAPSPTNPEPTDTNPMTAPAPAAPAPTHAVSAAPLNMSLSSFTDMARVLEQVPGLVAERDQLARDLATLSKQYKALEAEAEELRTRPMTAAPAVLTVPDQGNDLDAVAQACRMDRAALDSQLAAFMTSCQVVLPNAIRWPGYCDPTQAKPVDQGSVVHLFNARQPFALTGPSGSGKTFVLEALCQHACGGRSLVSLHRDISYSKLFIKERVSDGKTMWQLGPVCLAMLAGVPFIADEIDHADVFVQSILHGILDNNHLFVPELGLTIQGAGHFRLLATCNSLSDEGGQYHGEVGTALRTRLAAVFVDYPDQRDETETVKTAAKCSAAIAKQIAAGFAALRKSEREHGNVTGPFSVRESCRTGKLAGVFTGLGMTADQAVTAAFTATVLDKRPPAERLSCQEVLAQAIGIASNAASLATETFLDTIK